MMHAQEPLGGGSFIQVPFLNPDPFQLQGQKSQGEDHGESCMVYDNGMEINTIMPCEESLIGDGTDYRSHRHKSVWVWEMPTLNP